MEKVMFLEYAKLAQDWDAWKNSDRSSKYKVGLHLEEYRKNQNSICVHVRNASVLCFKDMQYQGGCEVAKWGLQRNTLFIS